MKSVKTQVKDMMLDNMCFVTVHEKVTIMFFCQVLDRLTTNKLFTLYSNVKDYEE